MGISFIEVDNKLVLEYIPDFDADGVRKSVNEGKFYLKRTFSLSKNEEISVSQVDSNVDDDYYKNDEYFTFVIGEKKEIGGTYFFELDKKVFDIKHSFYFDSRITIEKKLFTAVYKISIIKKIDDLVESDVIVAFGDENKSFERDNVIPYNVYLNLISQFPNTYELQKYSIARISGILRNYISGLGENCPKYERYLNKKLSSTHSVLFSQIEIKKLMFTKAANVLREMLKNCEQYKESDWQNGIHQIICTIYPEYILSLREVNIGKDFNCEKKPDFLLITASGNVDILEIKKPNSIKLITSSTYRNNYVADRDLEGAVVQIEKYLFTLNRHVEKIEKSIEKRCKGKLPEEFKLRIISPQGMLLMGRSKGLDKQQLEDFELIKRQYRNIVDIITYDDLMMRIDTIIKQLQS